MSIKRQHPTAAGVASSDCSKLAGSRIGSAAASAFLKHNASKVVIAPDTHTRH